MVKFGKISLVVLSLALVSFFFIQYVLFAFAEINSIDGTSVTTVTAPASFSKNGTSEVFNFTINISVTTQGEHLNATEFNITVPNVTATASNFTIGFNLNIAHNASGTWVLDFPENYTSPVCAGGTGCPRIIRINNSNGANPILNGSAITIAFNATPVLNALSDNVTQEWRISVRYNQTTTLDITSLNTSVDSQAPRINTTTPHTGTYIKGLSSEFFNVTVIDLNLNTTSNATLWYKQSLVSTWSSSVTKCYGTAPTFFCNTTVDLSAGQGYDEGATIQFFYNASDTLGNVGYNATASSPNTVTIDRTAPQFNTNVTSPANGTQFSPGVNYYFNISLTENYDVATVYLEWSNKTTTNNYTASRHFGTNTNGNWSVVLNDLQANTTGNRYRWIFNDSAGNANTTDYLFYTILRNTSATTTLTLNGTTGDKVYDKGAFVNMTAWANVSVLNTTITTNFTGSFINFTSYYLRSNATNTTGTSTLALGNYSVRAISSNRDENYTNTSQVEYIVILQDLSIPNITRVHRGSGTDADEGKDYINGTVKKNGDTLSLNISVTDNDGFASAFNVTVRIGTTLAASGGNITNTSSLWANGTITIPTISSDGNYTLNISVNDTSSNTGWNTTFVVDIDNTPPNISAVVPANNTYIAGTASQLFRVNMSEQHLNITHNVTLFYALGIASPIWKNGTMQCWRYAEANYTCNTTLNLEGGDISLANGAKLYYYVNSTDNATNWANKPVIMGNSSNPLVVTKDTGAPQYADVNYTANVTYRVNVTGKYDGVNISVYWSDNLALDKAILETNESGHDTNYSTIYLSPQNMSGKGYWANFTWGPNSSLTPGDVVKFRVYANDSYGSQNVTVNWTFTIDNTVPRSLAENVNTTNNTVIAKGAQIRVTANWTDNINLNYYWTWFNGTNLTGINTSFTVFSSGNRSNASYTLDTTGFGNGNLTQLRIYVNDTSNNQNFTELWQWTIDNTVPVTIAENVNTTNNTVIAKGAQIRVTANWTDNIGLTPNGYWWAQFNGTNLTGVNTSYTAFTASNYSNATFILNTSTFGNGNLTQVIVFANDSSGNQNSTALYQWTIDNTVPLTIAENVNTTNNTVIAKGAQIRVTANWTDNTALTPNGYWWVWFNGTNLTGVNTSYTAFTASNYSNASYTLDTSNFGTSNLSQIIVYANDTSGNENRTYLWQFLIDGTVPLFSNESTLLSDPQIYIQGRTYRFNISVSDNINISTVFFEWNATTNYTATLSLNVNGTSFNYTYALTTDLPVSNKTYKWFANDTSNNWNSSQTFTFNVTRNTSTTNFLTIAFNGTANANRTYTYPESVNATGWANMTALQGSVTLYRELTNVTTGAVATRGEENIRLGNGTYNYTLMYPQSENYTAANISYGIFVLRGNVTIYLALNGTSQLTATTKSYTYPQAINATGWRNATLNNEGNISLYRNGTIVSSRLDSATLTVVEDILLGNATYNYTLVYFASNYSNMSVSDFYAYVNKGTTNTTLYINSSIANASVIQGAGVNFTTVVNTTYNVNISIVTNITNWGIVNGTTSKVENITNTSGFTVGYYNITAIYGGYGMDNINFSTSSATLWLNITADTLAPTVTVYDYSNDTWRRPGASIVLNVSVADGTGSGVTGDCSVTINATKAVALTRSGSWCNGTVVVNSSIVNGNVTINVSISDVSGNLGFNDSYSVVVDITPPTITISTPSNLTYVANSSNGRIWINGTIYDNVFSLSSDRISSNNVTINNTKFLIFLFNGTNNTAFAISNTSGIGDGYVGLIINYTDNATNTQNATINFYIDNTPPSPIIALTNSTTRTYSPNASQRVEVTVVDNYKTNETVTLNYRYYLNAFTQSAWVTARMTNSTAIGINTIFNTTIYTGNLSSGESVQYYITGSDNATNTITVGGSATSSLANITIGTTGSIDGYVLRNGTNTNVSGATVSDGTRATVTNTNGYYIISSVPQGTYTLTASATDYVTNSTSGATVTTGVTTRVNITLQYNATGIIQGYVKSNDTTPVLLVSAVVTDGTRAAITNINGFYQITGVPAGTYTLNVSKTDYISNSTTSVVVTAGAITNVNLTMANNATGSIAGYVYLTNTTSTVPNSSVRVSDGSRTTFTNNAGYYLITGVPAGTYTLTIGGDNGYWTNTTSATVSAGTTTSVNTRVTGAESFNITLPGTSGTSTTGFWDTGWRDFNFRTGLFATGTTNHSVENLFYSVGRAGSYNYTTVWRYNATSQSWISFIPATTGNTLVNISSSDDHYWVYMNATDRVELEARYV